MTLHQPVLAHAPIANRAGVFRLKALFSEARARESTDPKSSEDWAELAVEWHAMANLADRANGEISPIEGTKR
jgi:hypothetical protein